MKRRRCGDMPLSGEIFGHRTFNQQTTPKRQLVTSRRHTSWFSILSVLYFSANVGAQQSLDLECYELLQETRHSQWFELGASDYATIVSRMSKGELEPLFDQLPGNFHENFRINAKQPCRHHQDWGYCIDLQSSQNAVPTFCRELRSEIEASIEEAPSPSKLPRAPSIYPSTNNKRQDSDSRDHSSVELPPSPIPFQAVHQDRRRLQTFQDCKINISIADGDRSNRLRKAEYLTFLNRMSNNLYSGSAFEELPQRYQDYFENTKGTGGIDVAGARPGQTATTAQTDSLTRFCDDTLNLISTTDTPVGPPTSGGGGPTLPPAVDCDGTVSEQQCFIALSISDRNRDDLLQEDDYIRFVNRLSNNEYVDAEQLGELPSNIQSNFRNLEDNGAINIEGSKPGQSASEDQEFFLSRVCCETDLAVQDPGAPGPPSGGPFPTPAPVGPQCVSSISRQQCNIFLSIADLSKDNFLNQVEYVRLLDRLSKTGDFSGVAFADLPAPYIANYEKFATVEGQIDVFGSKPGQTAGDTQSEFVDELCCETNQLVETGSPPPTPVQITPSPTISAATPSPSVSQGPSNVPSIAPSIATAECFQNLQEADLFKDSFLSSAEYVRLVNQIGANAFEGLEFTELPCQFIFTFERLSNDGGTIPITGATSNTATDEQIQEALNVCTEVSQAVGGQGADECSESPSMAPGVDPTEAPITSPPTAGPIDGEIEIFNAFVILNTRGIVADRLGAGSANRIGLDDAYATFVTDSVGRAIASGPALTSSLRGRRRLDVALQAESASIYQIVDADCPVAVTEEDASCQVGYGRFRVDVTNEYAMQIVEQYTNFTQNDILNGLLQSSLQVEDPNSVLRIVDAFFPVRDPNEPTNPPATDPPQTDPGLADDGSSNTGAIVGGVLGGLLVCALCVGIGWYTNKRDKSKKNSTPTGGDDDNSVIGGDPELTGNIVRPTSSRENAGNIFDNIKNRFGGNNNVEDAEDILGKDDDDSDEEDKEFGAFGADFKDTAEKVKEKEKKGVFGFGGKKEKKGKESGPFGLQTVYDSDSSSNRENDFGKYGFEDPDVLSDEDEEGEDEDDAGSKEELFESNMSPAWATSETGFGSSWGAGGSNDLANDFFGKSFGDDNILADGTKGNAAGAPAAEVPAEGGGEDEGDNEEDSQSQSSFESSEDSTYESNNDTEGIPSSYNDDQNEPDNSSSADHDPDNSSSADSPEEGAEEEKGWAEKSERLSEGAADDEDDLSSEDDDTYDQSQYSGSVMSKSSRSSTTGERQRRIEFQAQVDALVRIVLPDQGEKVQEMMDQFRGREPELISTLQNMQERSATQRARQAVHRSKTRPARTETRAGGSYAGAENLMGASEGSAAGTAAIAAASLPIPAGGFAETIPEGNAVGFGAQDAFGGYPNEEEDSFYSGDQSREGDSYSDDGPSFAGDEDDQDRSYDDHDRSYDDQDRSYDDQDQGYDDDPNQDRSYGEDSQGSFYSGDDIGDAFGGQDANAAFGSQDAASAFGSQAASAFGSQDAASAFGSHDQTSAFDPNAFGGQDQDAFAPSAFGNQAFGSDAFGNNAFSQDDPPQPNDKGFEDEEGYSQGSYSQGSYSQDDQGDRGQPNDQGGFGDEEGYSQGSYTDGSYSQDPGGADQGGRPQGGFEDEEGYSQGSYTDGSYSQDPGGVDPGGRRQPNDQGIGDTEGYSQRSYSQRSYPQQPQQPSRLGHDDRGQPGDQGFGDEEDYSQGSYTDGSYSQEPDGLEQDDRRRPNDQGFGDGSRYSQGSYSQDQSQDSYDGQSYGEDDGGDYSGERSESFEDDPFQDPPDSFGAPPDSFNGGGGQQPDSFGAGGWPEE